MMKDRHLLGQACFQKAWSRSSGGPAGPQEGSSVQFLVKGERLEQPEWGRFEFCSEVDKSPRLEPSANRAISCSRPVVPRSMPVLSSSSLSRKELAVDESERSVTCPTFMGRPANSKPFSCSKAFFAHSASANFQAGARQNVSMTCLSTDATKVRGEKDAFITEMKPYPLERPVSLSIINWIPSIFKRQTKHPVKFLKFKFKYRSRVASDLSERLEDSSQHLLGDVEVQRSHVESHRTRAALLEVVGGRCSSVLLGLRRAKHKGTSSLD